MEHEYKNLLIVDDEEEILKALRRQFRKIYNIFEAGSAGEAYKILSENPIQVIISDQRMPEMNGTEFLSTVKSEFPDAIRLILTGYADIKAVIDAINAGNVFRYVTKPWDPTELDTIVREAFDKYQMTINNRKLLEDLKIANEQLEQKVEERTNELFQANQKLTELNVTKDKFFSIIAHDLKNPFSNLLNLSEIQINFIREGKLDELERIARLFYESSKHGYKLLENLLEWSRAQTGSIEYTPTNVDIFEIVVKCIGLLENSAENKRVSINSKVPQGTTAFCDEYMVTTILRNLISNSIKFTKENGQIIILSEQNENELTLTVSDNGIGIKKEHIRKLFKLDTGFSTKGTSRETGTGLGLILCKEFVDYHKGKIWVESEDGLGSRFKFTLPKAN